MTSNDIYVVATAGGQPRRITRDTWYLKGFTWNADGKGLIAVSSRASNKLQMWPIDGGEPFRVGDLDAGRGSDLTLCRRTGSLAWVRDMSANSIWRMRADGKDQPADQLINSAAVDVDAEWSSDGRMVFRSDRSGVQELWIANADGSGPWQATHFRGAFVGDPHWSPNGRAIAFTSHINGNPEIFLMQCNQDKAACSEPRQLTRSSATDANPTWSHDGHYIYFSSNRSGNYEVWRVPVIEGTPQRITWNEGYMAREAADGRWLYYSKLWESTGIWRIALPAQGPGQTETPVAQNIPFMAGATWALGKHELFYYPSTTISDVPFPAVRGVDLATGLSRDLFVGNVRLSRGLALSPDERWLLRSQNDRTLTLIMLAEQER